MAEAEPGVLELTCTGGAQAKCVRFGYRPWETGPDGRPMRGLYNACVRMVRAEEKIRAVLPDEAQQQLLQVAASVPLLSVERTSYTYNDTPMELRRGLYLTDTHHYRNELN